MELSRKVRTYENFSCEGISAADEGMMVIESKKIGKICFAIYTSEFLLLLLLVIVLMVHFPFFLLFSGPFSLLFIQTNKEMRTHQLLDTEIVMPTMRNSRTSHSSRTFLSLHSLSSQFPSARGGRSQAFINFTLTPLL